MSHSLLRIESGLAFLAEFFKYMFMGKGLILSPIPEIILFANTSLLEDKTCVTKATSKQLDPEVPDNLPDIEIMPVS